MHAHFTDDWAVGTMRELPLTALAESYRRYRLPDAGAEAVMARSLQRYGQIAPVIVCVREEAAEVLDGFKRLAAARTVPGMRHLFARRLAADERMAKAAIYGLNRVGRRTCELEEAWIVQALVREDGLSQIEAAELLGRHKSWVCRRLALLERLGEEAREDLRLGLLSPTAARSLVALPAGNQAAVLAAARREGLTSPELRGIAELVRGAASDEQIAFVLDRPREALRQAEGGPSRPWDPRLSSEGNRLARQVGLLLELLTKLEHWLRQRGRSALTACDQTILQPNWQRLARDAHTVAGLAEDFTEGIGS